jgi:hypothetical protein
MAPRLSLRISGDDWRRLRKLLFTADGNENSGVLMCGHSLSEHDQKWLVREIVPVSPSQYIDRQPLHLEIAPSFYNSVIDRCLRTHLVPVICHSHPFDGPARYSVSDDFGERRLLPVLESLMSGQKPASLLLTNTSVAGRALYGSGFQNLDTVTIIGARNLIFSRIGFADAAKPESQEFDRQIRAFGLEGQHKLGSLTVAIVGLGGIGSLLAELLVRAGIGKLILVDFDKVETTNLSRMFGSISKSIGQPKVRIVAKHLSAIRPIAIETISDTIVKQSVLKRLRCADLLLGCVDSDLARIILSRFSYQYLIPFVDIGIRLDARVGEVSAAAGRVSVVGIDSVCLRCNHHIDSERVRAESLPAAEREALVREGYVMGIDQPVPAVVTLNSVMAGLGATAALNLFVNLTGMTQPQNQLYDARSGTVFTSTPVHESGCDICDEAKGLKALGDLQVVTAYE